MRIEDAIKRGCRELATRCETPTLDVEWLLLEVLGKKETSYLAAHGEDEVSPAEEKRYFEMVKRRANGEPLAYVLGWWEFYGRRFKITPDVLVPRPATEGLIDEATKQITYLNKYFGRPIMVADIGTGSGIIAITLQLELDELKIIATDLSVEALAVARENAEKWGEAGKIEWRQGNMLDAIKGEKVDLIISNPPYVPTAELEAARRRPTLDTVSLKFEPQVALDGGKDGQKLTELLKQAGIPYVIETTGGKIVTSPTLASL